MAGSVGIGRGRFETCSYYVYWLESGKGGCRIPADLLTTGGLKDDRLVNMFRG